MTLTKAVLRSERRSIGERRLLIVTDATNTPFPTSVRLALSAVDLEG